MREKSPRHKIRAASIVFWHQRRPFASNVPQDVDVTSSPRLFASDVPQHQAPQMPQTAHPTCLLRPHCYRLNCVPQNPQVRALTPTMKVLEGGASGR